MILTINSNCRRNLVSDMLHYAYRISLICIIIFMVSCTEKEKSGAGPYIQLLSEDGLISEDTIISPGEIMDFGIVASSGDFAITEYLIRVNAENSSVWFDTGLYTPNLKWYGSFVKSYADNETWEFVVRDRYGNENIVVLNIGNDSINDPGSVDYFENVILGAQNNNETGGFYNINENQVYKLEEAAANQELIDIVYYFGEDDHTIASPGANIESTIFDPEYAPATWDIRNTTRYIPLDFTIEEFNQIENDSILMVSYIEGEGKRKAKNLQAEKVFTFKTSDLRYGMFKVNEVTGLEEGIVSIDVKVQKEEGD